MFNAKHQKLLQNFLAQPMLSISQLQKIHATCFELSDPVSMTEMHEVVRLLNDKLKPLQLVIKSRNCEGTGQEFFVLLSTTEMGAAKYSMEFTGPELNFLKRILKEIVTSDQGIISSIDCINFSGEIDKMSKSDAQKSLDKFVTSQWLREKEGELSLTVRSLLELEPLLKKIDNELADCPICGVLAVKGLICASCGIKVHEYCLSKTCRPMSNLKCPNCSQTWMNPELPCLNQSSQSSQMSHSSQRNQSIHSRSNKRRIIESDSD